MKSARLKSAKAQTPKKKTDTSQPEQVTGAIRELPVYRAQAGENVTGVLMDERGGLLVFYKGFGLGAQLTIEDQRHLAAHLLGQADSREGKPKALAVSPVMGHA